MEGIRKNRAGETRAHEAIVAYDMEDTHPLVKIPEGVIQDGFIGAWIRKDIRGEADPRVERQAQKGWIPVPADRWPGISSDPLNRNPLTKQFVCCGDLILMERPKRMLDREREVERNNRIEKTSALEGLTPSKNKGALITSF